MRLAWVTNSSRHATMCCLECDGDYDDVEIQTNDAHGASVVWGRDMPCPFVRLED